MLSGSATMSLAPTLICLEQLRGGWGIPNMRIGKAKNFVPTPQRIDDVPRMCGVILEACFRRCPLLPVVTSRCQDLGSGHFALVEGARALVRNRVGAVREGPIDRLCT